ncbi:MAG: hypothetical protein HQK77_14695 [Desulfobacterales bacterium]|nr:hypothetical protein [Desulfobacterales bacterium]
MTNFSIQRIKNQAIIKVDLSFINIESLNRLFERLRIEELIQKADFMDDVIEIGKDIKRTWWQKNRNEYLKGVINADCDYARFTSFFEPK